MWWFEETLDQFKGFNISDLNVDEAWVNISSLLGQPVWLYSVSDNCQECPFQHLIGEPILLNHSYKIKVSSQYGLSFRFRSNGTLKYAPVINDSYAICDVRGNLGEFGVYSINVQRDALKSETLPICSLETSLAPVNIYLPIIAIFMFCLILCVLGLNASVLWRMANKLLEKVLSNFQRTSSDSEVLIRDDEHSRCDSSDGIDSSQNKSTLESSQFPSDTDEAVSPTLTRRKVGRRAKRKVKSPSRPQTRDRPIQVQEAGTSSTSGSQIQPTPKTSRQPKQERLKSLDVFRGLSIIIMIFVDDGGGGYYFLRHCNWDGLYVADLAFPWFLWICGVCIPISIQSKILNGVAKKSIFMGIFQRSLKLVLLGLIVNTTGKSNAVQLERLRIPGVLQRFGVCYFVGSILYLFLTDLKGSEREASHSTNPRQNLQMATYWKHIMDLKILAIPWALVLLATALHTSLIFLLPVPNCPTGYLGPAGLHRNVSFSPECVGGATGFIDRVIFGVPHIHNYPTAKRVYGSGAFDPEGTLGILTSVLNIWLGVQTGVILLLYKDSRQRLIRLLLWSFICGAFGSFLCGGYLNQGWIPINKNLWSLSFVLVTSSFALLLLSFLYSIIDVNALWSGRPLLETGMNSILLYLAHEICNSILPWHYSYGRMRTHSSKLIESCWGTALWILVAVYLHSRQWFLIV